MKNGLLKSIERFLKFDNKFVLLLAFIVSTFIIYLLYPHMNETLNCWNGEISGTVLDNISFKKRLLNFYILLIPVFMLVFITIYNVIIKLNIKLVYGVADKKYIKSKTINIKNIFFSINLSLLVGYWFLYSIPYISDYSKIKDYLYLNVFLNYDFYYKNILFLIILVIVFFIGRKICTLDIIDYENDRFGFWVLNLSIFILNITSYASRVFELNPKIYNKLSLISANNYVFVVLSLYISIILCSLIFKNKSVFYNNFLNTNLLYVGSLIFFKIFISNIYIVGIICIIVMLIYNHYANSKKLHNEIILYKYIVFFIYLFPIIYCFVYEVIFIAREKVFFDITTLRINMYLLFIYIVFSLLTSIFLYKRKIVFNDICISLLVIIAILVFVFFNTKSHYIFNYNDYANIFELGNNTVVYESIKYGEVPFIDYFPAHALYDIWTQFLYYIVHKNILGIFLSPYHGIIDIIGYLTFFFFIYLLFDDIKFALIFTLFVPLDVAGFKNITFNLISPVLIMTLIKEYNIKKVFLFWILTLISAFYLYDGGITLGVASIVLYFFYCVFNKKIKNLINFVSIGIFIGSIVLLFVLLYAYMNNINIISRILEWKSLTLNSFATLAHTNLGNYSSLQYFVSYFVFPAFAILGIIYSFANLLFNKEHNIYIYVLIIFSLSQILYISRGIAFHNYSITQGTTGVLFNYFSFTFCIFFIAITIVNNDINQKKIQYLLFYSVLTIIIPMLLTFKPANCTSSLIGKIINVSLQKDDIRKEEKYIQVDADIKTKKIYGDFKTIFDTLLDIDETFIDFANVTSVYAYTNRKLPVYVAQSPGLLSDLQSQYYFLDEIKNYKVPLAILGNSKTSYVQHIYDVQHNVRYFTIAEYIYNNYRPLVSIDEVVIYCLSNKYNEYIEKLRNLPFKIIDYGYDYNNLVNDKIIYNYGHDYYIKDLAYVMGKYENFDNDKIIYSDNSKLLYNIDFQRDKNYAYYLIFEINNKYEKNNISIELFDDKNIIDGFRYNLFLKEGNNKYALRISQDYLLLCDNKINSIRFNGINDADDIQIKIIKRKVEK